MSVAVFKASVWSALVNEALQARAVYRTVCNTAYQADAAEAGVIKVVTPAAVTIGNYAGTATIEAAGGASVDITLDTKKYFAVGVDDVDAAQAKADIMQAHTTNAGRGLAAAVDVTIRDAAIAAAGLTTGLGTDGTPLEINSANVIDSLIGPIIDLLDSANAAPDGRWIVVPPFVRTQILNTKMLLPSDVDGAAARAGFVGSIYGLQVLVSSQVKNTASAKWNVLAGSMEALAYADSLAKVEAFRNPDAFGDVVRGLHISGCDVIQPNALALAIVNKAAE